MQVILIITTLLAAVGLALWLHDRASGNRPQEPAAGEDTTAENADGEECCGMHITCERDSLLAAVSTEIEYFDDEELDRFRGRDAESYTDAETEEFRDVLLTLRPDEIAAWGRSIQLRGIELPQAVRQELLMIVAEARAARATTQ